MRNNTAQQTLAFTATLHARLIGFTPLPTEIVEIFFFFSHVKPEQQQWKLNEWSVFFQRQLLVDNTSNSARLAWIGLRNRFEAQDCAPTTPATFSILMLRQRQRISPHCKRRERQKVFTPEHSRATATPVCVIFWLLTSRVQDEAIGKPSLSSIVWAILRLIRGAVDGKLLHASRSLCRAKAEVPLSLSLLRAKLLSVTSPWDSLEVKNFTLPASLGLNFSFHSPKTHQRPLDFN